ncbi:MAG TPA: FAD-binding protein [Acidobacteriota bacterium]|nr:FAD-binding protein [Acidobacteriota bacterium]
MKTNGKEIKWPYALAGNRCEEASCDVLIVGGGMAGCFAAITAARSGASVLLVEKAATESSGAAGSGCDHWESAATNPCSKVTPEELADAMVRSHAGYNNAISHYIECREGYDRLLDLEKMGARIRDMEDRFRGAPFRDEKTKLLFAYDYENRFTLRVFGSTFKQALYRECKRAGVRVLDRCMATALLNSGGIPAERVTGAVLLNARTGQVTAVTAKAVILCTSRPARIWLFSPEFPGISEFRPPQTTGDGHALAWRIGAQFAMMEKSVKGEWSGIRSYPPYSTGNNHNTWYACTLVDATGRDIPWADRDGRILADVASRYKPAPGQKFFLKGGGEPDFPFYEFQGPEVLGVEELLQRGYKLPFYADLGAMPEMERLVIWGMMVGEEGKTRVPVLQAYERDGFDPDRDLLQSYGDGWKSGSFLPQERQLFGVPGGVLNDWRLMTNIEGLFAAGDILFAGNCVGHAAATGGYAARHAAAYAAGVKENKTDSRQIREELDRIRSFRQAPGDADCSGPDWKEFNAAICRIMQNYCGALKSEELLSTGLEQLAELRLHDLPNLKAHNPHELVRCLEVESILTNAELVIQACRARRASSRELQFQRLDFPEIDPPEWNKFLVIENRGGKAESTILPLDFAGDLAENYERYNPPSLGSKE